MQISRFFILTVLAIACSACGTGSQPETKRMPRDQRLSIRNIDRGTMYYHKGCYRQSIQHFQSAHERYTAADNLKGAAESLNSLANAYYRINDPQSAVLIYDEAVELYRLLEDKNGWIRALTNKSAALAASGNIENAEISLNQADALAAPDNILAGLRYRARAILHIKKKDYEEARKLLSKALRTFPKKDTGQYTATQYAMGRLLLSAQKPQAAISYLNRALEADQRAKAYFDIGQDLETLGDCHVQLKKDAQAVNYYRRSIKIFALLKNDLKVKQITPKFKDSALRAGTDIKATLKWVELWLTGQYEANICR